MCEVELDTSRKYPIFRQEGTPPEDNPKLLRSLATGGLKERYGRISDEMRERLEYELGVVEQTGYVDQNPALRERLLSNAPLQRFGRVDELKGTTAYLASQASSFMTGSVIMADGGTSVW